MIRKFNYTGRVKIPERQTKIKLFENGSYPYFNAYLDLQELKFPIHARIFVEAYFASNFLRFDYGTIGQIKAPAQTSLIDLPNIEQVRFRVKIVDDSGVHFKIIGISDNIYPDGIANDDNRRSILPVSFEDIGSQIWKVVFRAMGPVLILNCETKYPGIRNLIKSNQFFLGLIYPTAIRFILQRIVDDELFDSDDWGANWITFTREVLGVYSTPDSSDDGDMDEWIDEVVSSYCAKFRLLENIQKV
ncbi:hypothetical protein PQ469_00100 [Mucilaginibacter sp. KACC 22773]|uniref:hypothetical protein n=1 Tax=Mucilaginibacter sp. KACC 22773 TaxID=3025671 RepID=UPI002365DFB1|nr:hypothetical protein [Mucilaginibacter sp. KACC 22773]WDF78406.1 hypothetical protein PQ469_00100 [Mucilaginibacter sp. KACC 22773]